MGVANSNGHPFVVGKGFGLAQLGPNGGFGGDVIQKDSTPQIREPQLGAGFWYGSAGGRHAVHKNFAMLLQDF